MSTTHTSRTTTETSRWEGGKWVPIERTVRTETHTDAPLEHVVSDTETCWCDPTVVKVDGK